MPVYTKTKLPKRNMNAIWWPRGVDTDTGLPTYLSPIQIKCRWDDMQEKFLDLNGNDTVSNSIVYPDRETPLGGVLWLGTMGELTSQTLPFDNPGAMEIRKFNRIGDVKSKKFIFIAYL